MRSENARLGVREDDKVYQGFSVAFDMSFEEIWISYLVGATLWIAPKEIAGDPEALPRADRKRRDGAARRAHAAGAVRARRAGLRIINLGGEMCPQALVDKWATPARQMFNTYGPTEGHGVGVARGAEGRRAGDNRRGAAQPMGCWSSR